MTVLVHDPQIAVLTIFTIERVYNRGLYRSQFPFFFLGKPSVSIISKMDLLTFERLVSKLYFGVPMQG